MNSVAMAENIQTNIEIMTRKLELEKRRLHRLEVEHATAQKAYELKSMNHRMKKSSEGSRPYSAPRKGGSQFHDDSHVLGDSRPKSGRGPRAHSASIAAANHNASVASSASSSAAAGGRDKALNGGGGGGLGGTGGSFYGGGATRRGPWLSIPEYIQTPGEPGYAKDLLLPETGPWRTLLHRLDAAVKKLDCVRHDNTRLQEEVDLIRRQRLQLNSIFERLKLEIRQRAGQLTDVNEETATGLVVQGEAQQRIAVMKKQREGDRGRFKEQVLKIRRDLKDYDFEKKEVEVKLKRAQDGVQKKRGLIMPPEESEFSEAAMMRRIMKTAFLNCIQRRHIKQHEKTIAVFEQAFATIKQSTGISNIDEIVKIFIHLESKNYSLLTYVNHMNREVEALEGIRLRRKATEMDRADRDEKREKTREDTIGTVQRQLEAKDVAISATKQACMHHRDLMQKLKPLLQTIVARIQEELDGLKKAAGPFHGDFLQRLPPEIRDEAIPDCLEWIEKAMGRFRDLIKGQDRERVFPITARSRVTQLPPKRLNAPNHPLVNKNELPFCMVSDDVPSQKRANITAAQKADILDEEAEEEDFGDKPLSTTDIRERAEKAIARRKKGRRHHADTSTSNAGAGHGFGSSGDQSHSLDRRKQEADEDVDARRHSVGDDDENNSYHGGVHASGHDDGHETKGGRKRGETFMAMQDKDGGDAQVSEEELGTAFLKRYRMSREELQVMADRLGVHLSNLCFLKQEFDHFDLDQSGYMDAAELKSLLKKLGEDMSEDELTSAFQDLDSDGSGEIEFFEFVEWFTSED